MKVSIQCKSNQKWLDGRDKQREALMSDGNRVPKTDIYLQWSIIKNKDRFIKSRSSGCYLDGRDKSGREAVMTNRQPYHD